MPATDHGDAETAERKRPRPPRRRKLILPVLDAVEYWGLGHVIATLTVVAGSFLLLLTFFDGLYAAPGGGPESKEATINVYPAAILGAVVSGALYMTLGRSVSRWLGELFKWVMRLGELLGH